MWGEFLFLGSMCMTAMSEKQGSAVQAEGGGGSMSKDGWQPSAADDHNTREIVAQHSSRGRRRPSVGRQGCQHKSKGL